MHIKKLRILAVDLALGIGTLLFSVDSYADRRYKEPLEIGEVILFTGPYCQHKDTALLIGRTFESNFKKGAALFNNNLLCIRIIRLITVLNVVEDFGTYRVVKVKYANTLNGYLITSTKVVGDDAV